MKKTTLLFLFLLVFPLLAPAQERAPYDGTVSVTFNTPVVRNGEAAFSAELDFSQFKLPSAMMLELTPVLQSTTASRQVEFAPILVVGSQLGKVVARDERLGEAPWDVKPSQVITLGRRDRRASVAMNAPYEEWMQDATLVLVERCIAYGDGPLSYGDGTFSHTHSGGAAGFAAVPVLVAEQPVPVVSQSEPVYAPVRPVQATAPVNTTSVPVRVPAQTQIQAQPQIPTEYSRAGYQPRFQIYYQPNPTAPAVKTHSESFSGKLWFAQNNSLINRTIADNAVILAEVDAKIRAIQGDPLLPITAINVTGFASPEGEAEGNRNLSDDRARTFVNYLSNVHNLRAPQVKVTLAGRGEDWGGLRHMVENSMMDDRYRILDALDNYSDVGQRRAALQQLNDGSTYAVLLNYYSTLRRVEFTIEYGSGGSGTNRTVYDESAREIERGAYDAAISRLSGEDTPQAWNNMGVAYWHKGDYDRSQACFRKAADAGLENARYNLTEYRKWSDNRND